LLSFNPVILNVVAEDVPMWYEAGVGPDIILDMVYNSNDQQEISGPVASPTQYYPLGMRWSFSYATFYSEQSADEILIIMPDGARETYTFTGNSSLASHGDNFNTLERYVIIGGYGYALTMKESKYIYRYDNPYHHKLTSIEDRNGNTVELNYNLAYNLESISDANGRLVEFVLNNDGRIIQATDPLGRTALFEYGFTDNNFLTGITDMGGYSSTIEYNSVQIVSQQGYTWQPQIVSITTPTGTTAITWTATGVIGPNSLAYYWTFTNPNGISSTTYFSYGGATTGIIKMYDNNGNFDETFVDLPNYRINHIVTPDPAESIFYGYDASGNVNSVTTGYFEEQYVYDEFGNITQFTNPRGQHTYFTFDENNNLLTITDPMERVISFEYDENDNLLHITTPFSQEHLEYFPDGNLKAYTDGNGNNETYEYDAYGYLSSINYPLGNPATITNDDLGRMLSITSDGLSTEYEYDDLDQITKITYPDGTYIEYTYDFQNMVQLVDRGKRKIDYTYDGMNQVISSQGPEGYLSLERDGNGNITRVSINGQNTYYVWDAMNRLIREVNPDGTSKQYTYNEIGNVLTRVDENGLLTTYSYFVDLLSKIDYSDNTPDVSFGYNNNGEVVQMIDGLGVNNFIHDDGGRLVGYSGPGQGNSFTYTYDSAFNKLSMNTTGLHIDYTYDALSRLTRIESDYAEAEYTFDDNNNLVNTLYGNDSYSDFAYDDQNRIASLGHKKSTDEIITAYQYQLDDAGMLQSFVDHDGNITSYEYDYKYQLVNERVINENGQTLWHNKFEYDNLGNLVRKHKNGVTDHYTYNVNSQLTSLTETSINVSGIINGDTESLVFVEDVQAELTYIDANTIAFEVKNIPLYHSGDTIDLYARVNDQLAIVGDSSKFICTTNTSADGIINIYLYSDTENVAPENTNTIHISKALIDYEYDNNGNLILRNGLDGTTAYSYDAENRLVRVDFPSGDYEEYVYDGFGQRVQVLMNGAVTYNYIYDNYFEPVAITDADGNTTYITRGLGYDGGIGGMVGAYNESTGNLTNYFNHRGDLIAVTNALENVESTGVYDAFGSLMSTSGTGSLNFGFSSKEFDANSKLYYYGGRYYSPSESRWLTRDPMGFEAGFNMYAFVRNNPAMWFDPFGYDIPPDIEAGLRALNDHFNSTKGVITREAVINACEQLARTGKMIPNFMSRVSGMARAGTVFTGILQTFLTPEGAAAMKGAIQLVRALKREQDLVRRHNLLGCGQDLRPNLRRAGRKIKRFKKSFIGRLLFWPGSRNR